MLLRLSGYILYMGAPPIFMFVSVNGLINLRKQFKEKISDYRSWDQLEHAHDYILYPENMGEILPLDETCLSDGDVDTILTNKADKGRKGLGLP